jgi:hypothetical protein
MSISLAPYHMVESEAEVKESSVILNLLNDMTHST